MHVAGRVARGRAVFSGTGRYQIGFHPPAHACIGMFTARSHRNVRGEKCALLIGQSSATLAASLTSFVTKCRTADETGKCRARK